MGERERERERETERSKSSVAWHHQRSRERTWSVVVNVP